MLDEDAGERTTGGNRREALFPEHELSTQDEADPFSRYLPKARVIQLYLRLVA